MTASRDKATRGIPPDGDFDDDCNDECEILRLISSEKQAEFEDSHRRYAVGRRLAQLVADVMSKRVTDSTVIQRLRKLADWWEQQTMETEPEPAAAEQGELVDDARLVFEHWQKVAGHPRAKFEPRRDMIRRRLRDFTVDELKLVIDFAAQDEFWGGEKTRDGEAVWLEGYMKTHRLVEQLLARAQLPGQQTLLAAGCDVDEEIEELERRAARLAREGEIDDANAIQRDIRKRLDSA